MGKHKIAQLPGARVVFPENTKSLYEGVEFGSVPSELAATLNTSTKTFGPFANLAPDEFGISCQINTRNHSARTLL